MRRLPIRATSVLILLACLRTASSQISGFPPRAPVDLQLDKASSLFVSGKADEAIALASQAIEMNTNHLRSWFIRGRFHQETDQPAKAVTDFLQVVRLNSNNAPVWQQLGTEYFRLMDFTKSLECFDRFIEKMPQAGPGHWQRGVVAFEAGKFDEAFRQFEQYRQLDTNDVEVAVWQFLCAAKLKGLERARLSLQVQTNDARVPMTEVNRMFAGSIEPAEVLRVAAINTAKPPEKAEEKLNAQMFYAHLYVGLYYEATGKLPQAVEHLGQAAQIYRVKNFMGEIARVHVEVLRKKLTKPEPSPR